MNGAFRAVELTKDVYWVGAIDWAVRDFHGYETSRGTTYNAYLLTGGKPTLVDTVKHGFRGEMMDRIASVIDPKSVEVIVSNHAEPDHSGELADTIKAIEPETVYASKNGQKTLDAYYGLGDRITVVGSGDTIDLGGLSLTIAETRMCHWPDSMVSYLPGRKILFSQDAFGMHLASHERFDDEIDPSVLHFEAGKYYANILLPLGNFVGKALEELGPLVPEIDIIAPDHGPIWRAEPGTIVKWYADWVKQERNDKVVILYDTMWGSTALMARAVSEGVGAGGGRATVMALAGVHRSDVATRLLDSGGLILGSSTLNKNMLPRMADVLNYIRGLQPKGLVGGVFGSYGWSGEMISQLQAELTAMNAAVVGDPVSTKYAPDAETLVKCFELGKAVAEAIREK